MPTKNVIYTEYNGLATNIYFEPNSKTPSGYEFMGVSQINEYDDYEWASAGSEIWQWAENMIEAENQQHWIQQMVAGH